MSTLIELERDPTDGIRVAELPEWLAPATAKGRYWHQPRSAAVYDGGRVCVTMWCGQSRSYPSLGVALIAAPAPERDRCGTCAGRCAGRVRRYGLIFSPRDHWALPAMCPSTDPDPSDFRLCLACGRRTNAAGGWNGWGLAQHRPDPALAERCQPCPQHGWSQMRMRSGTLFCWAHRCEFDGGPNQ